MPCQMPARPLGDGNVDCRPAKVEGRKGGGFLAPRHSARTVENAEAAVRLNEDGQKAQPSFQAGDCGRYDEVPLPNATRSTMILILYVWLDDYLWYVMALDTRRFEVSRTVSRVQRPHCELSPKAGARVRARICGDTAGA